MGKGAPLKDCIEKQHRDSFSVHVCVQKVRNGWLSYHEDPCKHQRLPRPLEEQSHLQKGYNDEAEEGRR